MRCKPWEEIWTHKAWSDGARRQIDYILTDEVRLEDTTDTGIECALEGKSDHRGVLASFQIAGRAQERRRRARVQRGWKAFLDCAGKPAEYHRALDSVCYEQEEEKGRLFTGIIYPIAIFISDFFILITLCVYLFE